MILVYILFIIILITIYSFYKYIYQDIKNELFNTNNKKPLFIYIIYLTITIVLNIIITVLNIKSELYHGIIQVSCILYSMSFLFWSTQTTNHIYITKKYLNSIKGFGKIIKTLNNLTESQINELITNKEKYIIHIINSRKHKFIDKIIMTKYINEFIKSKSKREFEGDLSIFDNLKNK